MRLSVIIVNYNVRQFLENALLSIRTAMSGIDGEVFVVDNASSDGSAAMVRQKFPDVRLIESPTNVGFARGNNLALRQAAGDYLLLINPDTIVQEDTFHVMIRYLESHPEVGLAGCKVLNPDGTFQLPCRRSFPTPWVAFTKIFGLSALFPASRAFGRYNLTYLSPDETYRVDAVSGSFMMITRRAYAAVGGLDESFFMYGEDLDWCYRVRQVGFLVAYVHTTSIIHFKGESTRRSDIDEVRHFYSAMEVFVEKHYGRSRALAMLLRAGIGIRGAAANISRSGRPLLHALIDATLVDLAIFVSAWIYFQDALRFPVNANLIVWFVPALLLAATGYFSGLYTRSPYSGIRASAVVVTAYTVISAVVLFAKPFAYSRAVLVISGVLALALIPGWRVAARRLLRGLSHHGRRGFFGSRAVIVGTGPTSQEVLRRLRARVSGGYDIVGFIAKGSGQIGETISGVEVIGSLDNVGKVIAEQRISDVIFATDGVSYADVLSVVARSRTRGVNFRLVPGSVEAIVGKTRIDELDTLPLVDIEYNIQNPRNRLIKRLADVVVSLPLVLLFYLPVRLLAGGTERPARSRWVAAVRLMPDVLAGRLSLVGRPLADGADDAAAAGGLELGPRGLTGLVQINWREDLDRDEIERYKLYYAKNQSMILDIEILLRTLTLHRRTRERTTHG